MTLLAEPAGLKGFDTKLDRMCKIAYECACAGDAKFAALILERVDPATRYRVSMHIHGQVTPQMYLDHLRGLGGAPLTTALPPPAPTFIDQAPTINQDEQPATDIPSGG